MYLGDTAVYNAVVLELNESSSRTEFNYPCWTQSPKVQRSKNYFKNPSVWR